MIITPTDFEGLVILEPKVNRDARGYFMEAFNVQLLKSKGFEMDFVQDNQSYSTKNVIRGLHFQTNPHAQTKLVRVLSGVILDVVVDLRKDLPTYRKVFTMELSAENAKQLLVPRGFAHGFSVLSDAAEILYKIDNYYNPKSEGGILCNDPDLAIDWKVAPADAIVSDKDLVLPRCKDLNIHF